LLAHVYKTPVQRSSSVSSSDSHNDQTTKSNGAVIRQGSKAPRSIQPLHFILPKPASQICSDDDDDEEEDTCHVSEGESSWNRDSDHMKPLKIDLQGDGDESSREFSMPKSQVMTSPERRGRAKRGGSFNSGRRNRRKQVLEVLEDIPDSEPGKKPRHNEPLNQHAIDIMQKWYEANKNNPYPTKEDKIIMAKEGGITIAQVKSWFANRRNRSDNTRPKVAKRRMEEKLRRLYVQLSQKEDSENKQKRSQIIDELTEIMSVPILSSKTSDPSQRFMVVMPEDD
jgi:hypothetical protein